MIESLSLSLCFNSDKPLNSDSPSIKLAIKKNSGSSSIKLGTISSIIFAGNKSDDFMTKSATSSFPNCLIFVRSIFAFMSKRQSRKAFLVLFIPTFLIFISEFSEIKHAPIKKAADEKSPGTSICPGVFKSLLSISTIPFEDEILASKVFIILSVWSLVGYCSCT